MKVNGERHTLQVEPWDTLLEVLRDELKFMKTKEGCSLGECGSCAVIMNKKAVTRAWFSRSMPMAKTSSPPRAWPGMTSISPSTTRSSARAPCA